MARKIVHQLIDDLDGTVLEPGAGETVLFALDGTAYEIDLTDKNAATIRDLLAPYIAVSRKAGRAATGAAAAKPRVGSQRDFAAIRAWAKSNGYGVSERGRVPRTVLDAYDAAH